MKVEVKGQGWIAIGAEGKTFAMYNQLGWFHTSDGTPLSDEVDKHLSQLVDSKMTRLAVFGEEAAKMRHIIGIIGAAGCGKTSVANRLTERFGFGQYSFATPLKQLVEQEFGWCNQDWDDLDFKESPVIVHDLVVRTQNMLRTELGVEYTQDHGLIRRAIVGTGRVVGYKAPPSLEVFTFREKPLTECWGQIAVTPREILQFVGTDVFRKLDLDHWVKIGAREIPNVPGAAKGVALPDVRFLNEVVTLNRMGGVIVRVKKPGGSGTKLAQHVSETALDSYEATFTIEAEHGDMASLYEQTHNLVKLLRE